MLQYARVWLSQRFLLKVRTETGKYNIPHRFDLAMNLAGSAKRLGALRAEITRVSASDWGVPVHLL